MGAMTYAKRNVLMRIALPIVLLVIFSQVPLSSIAQQDRRDSAVSRAIQNYHCFLKRWGNETYSMSALGHALIGEENRHVFVEFSQLQRIGHIEQRVENFVELSPTGVDGFRVSNFVSLPLNASAAVRAKYEERMRQLNSTEFVLELEEKCERDHRMRYMPQELVVRLVFKSLMPILQISSDKRRRTTYWLPPVEAGDAWTYVASEDGKAVFQVRFIYDSNGGPTDAIAQEVAGADERLHLFGSIKAMPNAQLKRFAAGT